MVFFEIDPIEPVADAVSILSKFSEKCHFKWTPLSFSVVVSRNRPLCISAIKMLPKMFIRFYCRRCYEVTFNIADFFVIMSYLRRMGVSSLSFCMPTTPTNQSCITLKYRIPCQEDPFNKKELPMSIVAEPVDVGDVDYGSFFVSMALEEFRCVVNDMENAAYVPVTITSSRIKFVALIDHWETSFTTKEGECIIGGIEEGQEIKCGISLYPMKFYKAFTSKRVWFFSSCDTNGLLLIAPMGVYTHISSFFPQEIISYVRNTFT